MAWLPLDSACENESENVAASNTPFHQAINGQDGEFKEELIKNKNVESSTSASAVCDFAHKHWRIIEQLDGFESEDKNEDRDGNCTSTVSTKGH
jgi:flagellar basal body rod protein FlgB